MNYVTFLATVNKSGDIMYHQESLPRQKLESTITDLKMHPLSISVWGDSRGNEAKVFFGRTQNIGFIERLDRTYMTLSIVHSNYMLKKA